MKYCPNCGNKIENTQLFCNKCGKKLVNINQKTTMINIKIHNYNIKIVDMDNLAVVTLNYG